MFVHVHVCVCCVRFCGLLAKSMTRQKKVWEGERVRERRLERWREKKEKWNWVRERENDRPGEGEIIVSLHLVPITISCVWCVNVFVCVCHWLHMYKWEHVGDFGRRVHWLNYASVSFFQAWNRSLFLCCNLAPHFCSWILSMQLYCTITTIGLRDRFTTQSIDIIS